MRIYLARHGQTNYNELRLCNADPAIDVYLTKTGIEQANELAEQLKHTQIDHIFVSELKRTKQTAEIVNKFHSAPTVIDSRLNDNRTGCEGKPTSEYYSALEAAENKWTARIDDGETLLEVKERVNAFIEELRTKNFDTVLIVTSMSVVQAFCSILNGLSNEDAWNLKVDKGSYRLIELS